MVSDAKGIYLLSQKVGSHYHAKGKIQTVTWAPRKCEPEMGETSEFRPGTGTQPDQEGFPKREA